MAHNDLGVAWGTLSKRGRHGTGAMCVCVCVCVNAPPVPSRWCRGARLLTARSLRRRGLCEVEGVSLERRGGWEAPRLLFAPRGRCGPRLVAACQGPVRAPRVPSHLLRSRRRAAPCNWSPRSLGGHAPCTASGGPDEKAVNSERPPPAPLQCGSVAEGSPRARDSPTPLWGAVHASVVAGFSDQAAWHSMLSVASCASHTGLCTLDLFWEREPCRVIAFRVLVPRGIDEGRAGPFGRCTPDELQTHAPQREETRALFRESVAHQALRCEDLCFPEAVAQSALECCSVANDFRALGGEDGPPRLLRTEGGTGAVDVLCIAPLVAA